MLLPSEFIFYLLLSCSLGAYGAHTTIYGALSIWLQIVLRCSLDSVQVSPAGGFGSTFISAFFATVVLFLVGYCSCFSMGIREGLLDLSRFMALLVPLGRAILDTHCQSTLNGSHLFL